MGLYFTRLRSKLSVVSLFISSPRSVWSLSRCHIFLNLLVPCPEAELRGQSTIARGVFFPQMGCMCSTTRKQLYGCEDPIQLASQTYFTVSEVEALFELFKSISKSIIDDGVINKEEFQLALFNNRKKDNLFANRIFCLFDVKQKGVIDFTDFVKSLNVFHPKAPLEDKINFSFKLYDLDGTGYIEREEVKHMLIEILFETDVKLADETIEMILDKTFVEADGDGDGKIDKAEWYEFVSRNPSLMKIMTLPYLRDITTTFPSFIFNSKVDEIAT